MVEEHEVAWTPTAERALHVNVLSCCASRGSRRQ